MGTNLTPQPLVKDWNVSRNITKNNFDNICDAVNNLQAKINALEKEIIKRKNIGFYIPIQSGTVRLEKCTVGGADKIKMQITTDSGLTWNDTGVDWDLS
jgi:hypothetical protein